MTHNITVEGGSSVRLTTAGKYCDRDIIVTAEGGTEDLNNVLTEQESLIAELKEVLTGKASGSGVENYAKFTIRPTSSTSIKITNPLGGIAKCFTIRRLSDEIPSSQKAYECVGSYNPPIGAFEFVSSSNTVRYAIQRTSGTINNAYFKITDGEIQVYRYNTANTWDTTSDYEVEIFGRLEETASTMMLQRDVEHYEESSEGSGDE